MIETKYFDFFFKAKVLKPDIIDIQKDGEILDIKTKDRIIISPYLEFIAKGKDISEFESNDLVQGFFADRFEVQKSNIIEEDEAFLIEVEFSFNMDPKDQVELNDFEIIYEIEDVHYRYDIEPSFTKAYEPSFLEGIKTDIQILSFSAKQSIEDMRIG